MLLDLAGAAVLLIFGNIVFHRFDPWLPWWKRVAKSVAALAVTAAVSWRFGHRGVLVELGVFLVPLIYIHGVWLPRHGVNGWTAEPRDKYYAIRGWPPPQ